MRTGGAEYTRPSATTGVECVSFPSTATHSSRNSFQLVMIDRIPFPRPDDPLVSARQRAVDARGGNGFLTVRAIKHSIDGALGPRGAWLLEPYSDKADSTGLMTTPVKTASSFTDASTHPQSPIKGRSVPKSTLAASPRRLRDAP